MRWEFNYVNPKLCHHHAVDYQKAYRYAKAMERGDKFPPVKIHIEENGSFKVKDGAHRTMAAKLCGMDVFVKVASTYREEFFRRRNIR